MSKTILKILNPLNRYTRRLAFDTQPSWDAIITRLANLYDVHRDDLCVSYMDNEGDEVLISSEQELQEYYTLAYTNPPYGTTKRLTLRSLQLVRQSEVARYEAPNVAPAVEPRVDTENIRDDESPNPTPVPPAPASASDDSATEGSWAHEELPEVVIEFAPHTFARPTRGGAQLGRRRAEDILEFAPHAFAGRVRGATRGQLQGVRGRTRGRGAGGGDHDERLVFLRRDTGRGRGARYRHGQA